MEKERVLDEVRAIPIGKHGTWLVKNIAQGRLSRSKEELKGCCFPVCKAKEEENGLLSTLGLEKAFVKIHPKNNSKG